MTTPSEDALNNPEVLNLWATRSFVLEQHEKKLKK